MRDGGDELALLPVERDLPLQRLLDVLVEADVGHDGCGVRDERGQDIGPAALLPIAWQLPEHGHDQIGVGRAVLGRPHHAQERRQVLAPRSIDRGRGQLTSVGGTNGAGDRGDHRVGRGTCPPIVDQYPDPFAVGTHRAAQRGGAGHQHACLGRDHPEHVGEGDELGEIRGSGIQPLHVQSFRALLRDATRADERDDEGRREQQGADHRLVEQQQRGDTEHR